MRLKLTLLTTLIGVVLVALAPTASAAPTSPSVGLGGTVTGTCSFVDTATGQTVNGTIVGGLLGITGFTSQGGQLVATGTLTGTCTAVNSLGTTVTKAINEVVQIPVTSARGSCRILHLELGPIDLDLLGLKVHLDKIVLDVTAQSGPGNLLGNLLCAVANALNSGAPATTLANLLNQILAILG